MAVPRRSNQATPKLEAVLDKLGSAIVSGVIVTDTTFTLQDVSEKFTISRTVARETMRALEQLGLVKSSRRVGITVLPPSSWAVFDDDIIAWRLASEKDRDAQLMSLTELRVGIEPIAARLMAARATDEQRKELRVLGERIHQLGSRAMGNSDQFLDADIRFHTLILEGSGNDLLISLAPTIAAVLVGRTKTGRMPHTPHPTAMHMHRELAHAIGAGDPDRAEKAAHAILTEVREALTQSQK